MLALAYNKHMANNVYYRGEGDENAFHDSEIERLRRGEEGASEERPNVDADGYRDGINNVRNEEDSPSGLNGSNVSEFNFWRGNTKKEKKKFFGGKKLRFLAPSILVALLIGGIGGLTFISSSLAPFALISNMLDRFNSLRVTMNARSTYFTRFQMDSTLNTSLTGKRFGIFSSEKFKISNSMQKKLARNNIEYKEDANTKARYLVYTDPNTGDVTPVVANAKDKNILNGIDIENSSGKKATRSVMLIDDLLEVDDNFFSAHQNATKTVKGHIAGWFESLTNAFYGRINTSRNRFNGLSGDTGESEVKQKAKSEGLLAEAADSSGRSYEKEDGTDSDGKKAIEIEEPDPDDPSKTIKRTEVIDTKKEITGSDAMKPGMDTDQIESSLKTRANKAAALVGKLGGTQSIACGVMSGVSSIVLAASGIVNAIVMNTFNVIAELVQRTQILGNNDGLSLYQNEANEVDENGVSVMSSVPINHIFGGPAPDSDSPEMAKFNTDKLVENAVSSALGDNTFARAVGALANGVATISTGLAVYKGCLYSGMGLSMVNIALSFASFFTGGISEVAKTIVGGIIEIGKKTIISFAIGLFVSVAVPKVAEWLTMDFTQSFVGAEAGAATYNGGFKVMNQVALKNGNVYGDKKAVIAGFEENQEILASDARYDRLTRSPFDPTSKYTFIGSIVNSLIPIGNMLSGNAFLRASGQVISTVGNALTQVMPRASALSSEWAEYNLNEDCTHLDDLGLLGNESCMDGYATTDFSLMALHPYEIVQHLGVDSFEGDDSSTEENPKPKVGSLPWKFITFCTLRDSQIGVKDANIASAVAKLNTNVTSLPVVNSLIESGVNAIPIVGDVYDLANASAEAENMKWITGIACINNEDVNPDWPEVKYAARYVGDQVAMETHGIIEKSTVAMVIEDYYKENPLDNSLEGVIARYSGMKKEDVENAIALAEYINFVSQYDPTDLYPLPVEQDVVEISIEESDGPAVQQVALVTTKYVVYADLDNAPLIG